MSTGHKVFFAGDGTTCQLIAQVTGAYLTGIEAAKRAIDPFSKALSLLPTIFSAVILLSVLIF